MLLTLTVLMYVVSFTLLPELTDTHPPAGPSGKPWVNATAAAIWITAVGVGLFVGWRTYRKNTLVEPTEPRCAKCGYNLTGNVSRRCPECGQPVKLDG